MFHLLNLSLHPGLEAVEVDVADRSRALANADFGVVVSLLLGPAEAAGSFVMLFSFSVLEILHIIVLASLVVLVLLCLGHKFLDSKLDSTKFENVVPLYLVILKR